MTTWWPKLIGPTATVVPSSPSSLPADFARTSPAVAFLPSQTNSHPITLQTASPPSHNRSPQNNYGSVLADANIAQHIATMYGKYSPECMILHSFAHCMCLDKNHKKLISCA
ncbi:unnamed protein product [Anisakis simplex]|uniref:Ovule protein n=1 Tax=Anisakis simplex TaxID=6269 RepID=A0A0M3KDS9_ANISI|nr:unnamed protein product [Anisakis simplex]